MTRPLDTGWCLSVKYPSWIPIFRNLLAGRTPELFSIVSLDEQARWNSTYCTGECTSHHEIALAASSMLWDTGHRDIPHPAQ